MAAIDTFGIVGTVIAEKYRVERVVDEGGFSLVYKAEHLIWREPVALKCFKVLTGAAADQRDQLLDAFIQEGKLMTTLSSRSAAIVQARDIGKLTTRDGQWIPYYTQRTVLFLAHPSVRGRRRHKQQKMQWPRRLFSKRK